MKYLPLPLMNWFSRYFNGNSSSEFVRREVIDRLPKSIIIQFLSEFDEQGNPIIFISSPEPNCEGIISEARTSKEAIHNAQDAILTHFDVPRDCAELIEFEVEEVKQLTLDPEDRSRIRTQNFQLRTCPASL